MAIDYFKPASFDMPPDKSPVTPARYKGITYGFDVIFCLDCGMNMEAVFESVKEIVLTFPDSVINERAEKGCLVEQVRVKFILFCEHHDPMGDMFPVLKETDFIPYLEEKPRFTNKINKLRLYGNS